MEQLLSKLSNLSYEILGIILPGLFTFILLVLWLVGTGDLLPFVSQGFFAPVTLSSASGGMEAIGVRTGLGILGTVLFITYFIGHLLNWMSRGGKRDDAKVRSHIRRTWHALTFRTPKFSDSFDPELALLFQAVLSKFSLPAGSAWRHFYPVARNYLVRTCPSSLVNLYQNKYTLHRSITAGAALIFWLSLATLLFGIYTVHGAAVEPRWVSLSFLILGCLTLVWGFSDSYAYNWQMFGSTIVTEAFSALNAPGLAPSSTPHGPHGGPFMAPAAPGIAPSPAPPTTGTVVQSSGVQPNVSP